MSDTSSSSDSDIFELSSSDDLDFFVENKRQNNENYLEHIIPSYNPTEFLQHFRMNRHVVEEVAEKFSNSQYFNYQAGGNGKLNSLHQILIYLWFVGHQTASFRDVSDRFNIAISTLYKIIRKVSYFLSNMAYEVITWPTIEEKQEIERHFQENNFPCVIGCIDGTHVKIDKPNNDPDSYLNRKHYFSIQLQIVCDHKRKIRDVFTGFPGPVHDSRVYRISPLATTLVEKCGNFYILGDSGYPCLSNLLIPFKDRGYLTRRQRNYNIKLSSNRYVIEHCFGILKQKFRQLYHVKLRSIPDTVHLIRACCVLHNLALEDDFPYIPIMEEDREEDQEINIGVNVGEDDGMDRNGIETRNHIVNILPL